MNILSGKLKDVCDALITNVTPVDGTYSEAISGMPTMHHDFITTTLPSGNKVANGYLLSLGCALSPSTAKRRWSRCSIRLRCSAPPT
ncbi:MAG: hypothetical protein V5B38_03850 [Candidatus Accumulibacter propinquus]|jgi:hypothetical protein